MSNEEKTRVTVDIFGTEYKMIGTGSGSYIRKIAAHVHEQMQKISKGHPRLDLPRIAVLAAVNITDEYFNTKDSMEKLQAESNKEQAVSADYKKLQESYNRLQELSATESARYQRLSEEHGKLREANERTLSEYEQLKQEFQQFRQDTDSRRDNQEQTERELAQLREEYAKLQTEYNEWIKLVETSSTEG